MPLKLQKVNMKIMKKYARETVKVPVNKMKKYYMNIETPKQFPPPTAVLFFPVKKLIVPVQKL